MNRFGAQGHDLCAGFDYLSYGFAQITPGNSATARADAP
jgi:hypothetical protein